MPANHVIIDEDSYTWQPNFLMYKDPDNLKYKGSVVGNTPLELQIASITEIGEEERSSIAQIGQTMVEEVKAWTDKYSTLLNLIDSSTNAIIREFGGNFALDSSRLDEGILF